MPATKDQKQFLHSLACYLAKDHDGFRDDGAAKRAQILDSGVFSHFWFNWQPIGVTVNAITKLRNDKVALGLRRHHINDRKAWRARLLSQEWLGLGAEGWFHEYEIRNRTVIGRASERTDHTQKHAIQWVELDNHSLFHNHTSGFHVRAGEKAWAQEAGRLDRIRTGVVEYILDQ